MTDFLRRYTFASYFIGLMFIIGAIVDAATNAWPWGFGNEQWRFGSVAILSGYLVSILFGLLVISLVAAAKQQRRVLFFISAFSWLMTVVLLATAVIFTLDTLQVHNQVRQEQVEMFKIGAAKTAFKVGVALIASFLLAMASRKTAKDLAENVVPPVLIRNN